MDWYYSKGGNATLLSERRVACTGRHIFLTVRIFCSYGWGLRKNEAGWAGVLDHAVTSK